MRARPLLRRTCSKQPRRTRPVIECLNHPYANVRFTSLSETPDHLLIDNKCLIGALQLPKSHSLIVERPGHLRANVRLGSLPETPDTEILIIRPIPMEDRNRFYWKKEPTEVERQKMERSSVPSHELAGSLPSLERAVNFKVSPCT